MRFHLWFAGVMANGISGRPARHPPSIQPQYWGIYAIAMLVAIVVPAPLTLLVYKRQQAAGKLDLGHGLIHTTSAEPWLRPLSLPCSN